MKKVYLYKGFERFWHWSQMVLVFALLISGFEIHGSYSFLGYREAVSMHNTSAWMFIVLIIFSVFWHITTGEWKQYVPTSTNMKAQLNYYLGGIFKNAPHPSGKRLLSKLNPLQRLTYFGLKIILIPLLVFSGLFYMFFHYPISGLELDSLEYIAIIHTAAAYLMIAFLIIHLYLITTGHSLSSNLKAMISGWEEMDDEAIKGIVEDVVNGTEKIIRSPQNGMKSDGSPEIGNLIKNRIEKNLN